MSYPHIIPNLTPREAVLDALYRAANAYDLNNEELHDSAFVNSPETSFDLDGTVVTGFQTIKAAVWALAGTLDTQHNVTCPRVQIHEGGKTARLTATMLAQHFKTGEGKVEGAKNYLGGSLWSCDLVRDEGVEEVWRIKHVKIKVLWTQGDRGVVTPGGA